RLRTGLTAGAFGMARLAFTVTRLAFTARLAAAARTLSQTFLGAVSFARTFSHARVARPVGIAGRFRCNGIVAFGERNDFSNQPFDGGERLGVERRDDRDRRAGASGASGTANAMHVIIGMMRHVEIEAMS